MKFTVVASIISFCIAFTSYSQQKNDWENPAVIGINKLKPRATMYSFSTEKEALSYLGRVFTQIQTIPGVIKIGLKFQIPIIL